MALDPSIALQGPSQPTNIDIGTAATKGMNLRLLAMRPEVVMQELANARAQEQATIASTAQQRVTTEETSRQNQGSRTLAEIGKKHTTVDPVTGKTKINKQAWMHEALQAGLPFEMVGKMAGEVATIKEHDLKDDTTRMDYANNRLFETDHLVRVQKDPAQAAGIVKHIETKLADVIGPERARKEIEARYGNDPTMFIQRANINASTSITPGQAEQFKIANEQLKQGWSNIGIANQQLVQAGAANLTSPEAMDRNSPVSQAYRDLAIKSGLPASLVNGLSAAQIHRINGMQDAIASVTPSAGVRADLGVAAAATEATRGVIDQALPVIDELSRDYGKPGTLTRAVWNKLVQDPKYAAIQSAIDQHNANNPTAKIDALDGLDAVKRRLSIESKKLGATSGAQRKLGGTSNLVETVGGNTPAPTSTVRMVGPNGAMYNVPADRVDGAKAKGLKVAQ